MKEKPLDEKEFVKLGLKKIWKKEKPLSEKIKDEIDEITESGDGEYGCIEAFNLCLKWEKQAVERAKKRLKKIINNPIDSLELNEEIDKIWKEKFGEFK